MSAGSLPRERRAAAILVALLTLAALGLRLVGIGHSLPQRPDDDSVAVGQAQVLRHVWAGQDAGPAHPMYYPLLLATTAAALGVCEPVDLGPEPAPLRAHLAAASRPFLGLRVLVVLISSACIPGMYLLARRVLGAGPSVVAAAIVAASLLHVDFSQQARPHAPAVTFAVFALAATLWAHERASVKRFALAGILAGLSAGTLQTGAAVVLPLGVALLSGIRRKRPHAWTEAIVAGALCAALTLLFYFHPYPREGAATFSLQPGKLMISGHPAEFALFNGQGFVKLGRFLLSYDPVVCALALLGGARILLSRHAPKERGAPIGNAALLAAHAVPYLAVFGMFSWISDRFALPLLPHLALLGAVGVEALASCLPRALVPRGVRLGLAAAIALALPTAASISYVAQHTRPETCAQAARYVEQHLSPNDDLLFLSARITLPLALHPPEGEPWPTAQWFAWEAYLKQRAARSSDAPTWTVHRITTLEDPKRNGPAEPLRAAADWPAGRRWALLVTPERGETDPARRALDELGAAEVAVFGPERIDRAGRLDAEEQGLRSRFARAFLDPCPGPRLSLLRW